MDPNESDLLKEIDNMDFYDLYKHAAFYTLALNKMGRNQRAQSFYLIFDELDDLCPINTNGLEVNNQINVNDQNLRWEDILGFGTNVFDNIENQNDYLLFIDPYLQQLNKKSCEISSLSRKLKDEIFDKSFYHTLGYKLAKFVVPGIIGSTVIVIKLGIEKLAVKKTVEKATESFSNKALIPFAGIIGFAGLAGGPIGAAIAIIGTSVYSSKKLEKIEKSAEQTAKIKLADVIPKTQLIIKKVLEIIPKKPKAAKLAGQIGVGMVGIGTILMTINLASKTYSAVNKKFSKLIMDRIDNSRFPSVLKYKDLYDKIKKKSDKNLYNYENAFLEKSEISDQNEHIIKLIRLNIRLREEIKKYSIIGSIQDCINALKDDIKLSGLKIKFDNLNSQIDN